MKLNKYTYNQIKDIRNGVLNHRRTEENIQIFCLLDEIKKDSSFTYKELIGSKIK
tara:strand:+ start:375 stop:539 length:165 start_codon:yes stop_codon:yes gene_type:complete